MLKNIFTVVMILAGVGFSVFLGYVLIILHAFGSFDKDYSVTDLKENYQKNEAKIIELKHYFNKVVPKNRFVEIEFENDKKLFRFGIWALDTTAGNAPIFLKWDLNINTLQMDSIIKPLGWTIETLKTLKKKLDAADCIMIGSGDPAKIGFKRSGLGMYSFNVFDKPIPDSLRKSYNDSCTYIYANNKLVLEYGGGAAGNQCFYNKN